MKQQITYEGLRQLGGDIARMQQSPALRTFLRKQTVNFYTNNAVRLEILFKTAKETTEKYVKHTEEGSPVTQTDEKGVQTFVFNNEVDEGLYLQEMKDFTSLTFEIEI